MNRESKGTVLVVDDDPGSLKLLFNRLRQAGFKVLVAEDGTSALTRVERSQPDIVLLDVKLPDIDGFEVCRRFQERYPALEIPVMFLTVYADIADKLKGLNLNAVDYITKPFQPEEVVARVGKHLALQHLRKRLEEKNAQLQQEIAERQRVEETLREREVSLKEAQRLACIGNWELDLLSGEVIWSEELYHILQIEPGVTDLHLNTLMSKLIHPDDKAMAEHAIQEALTTGDLLPFEFRAIRGDGEERVLWCRGKVLYNPDGEPVRLVGIDQDITERKRMEERLQKAKQAALEAQHAAEAANRAKSTFLANMSHELRTPLNAILGFAQRLEQDGALADAQRKTVNTIYRNGEYLLVLINDILDFTKIETNRLELHPAEFVLPGMLTQLVDMFRLHARRKGIALIYEAPADLPRIVSGDQQRLRQILLNLLGNAVRFTERGKVSFRVYELNELDELREFNKLNNSTTHKTHKTHKTHETHKTHKTLRFEIEDTGIGIAPDHLERIFQPFQQTDPYQLQEGSTGLGLAISQRLVKMMGNQLQVTSTEGQGSTFWFDVELPVLDATISDVTQARQEDSSGYLSQERLTIALAALPAEWLATLKQSAEETDLEALREVIEQIREHDAAVADALARLAEDFEYDEILFLMKETQGE